MSSGILGPGLAASGDQMRPPESDKEVDTEGGALKAKKWLL